MTIVETVTIPADRHLCLTLPASLPDGTARIAITPLDGDKPAETFPRLRDWLLHPILTRRAVECRKLMDKIDEYNRIYGPLFGGMDGMEFQRMMRYGDDTED